MTRLLFLQAFVDFGCKLTLNQVAKLVSTAIFGGIDFVGQDEGIWDEVPAVRLAEDILGLRVVLGGGDGAYTLEIESADFDWSQVTPEEESSAVLDITLNVKELLRKLPEVTLLDRHE